MAQATFPEWQVLPKKIVYYDLKTTNSKKMPLSAREIVSIGATCNGSIDDFFVEIIPNHPIDPKRSKLYGYTIQREKLIYTDQNGVEREVTGAVTIENALEKFIQYLVLVKFTNDLATEASEKIILVANNNHGFGEVELTRNLSNWNLKLPENVIMADSLDLIKETTEKSMASALKTWCNIKIKNQLGITALEYANNVKLVTDAGAKLLGCESYSAYLDRKRATESESQSSDSNRINSDDGIMFRVINSRANDDPNFHAENPLAFLRNQEEFQQIKRLFQQNPNMLSALRGGQSNLELLNIISQNRDAFIRMVNEPDGEDIPGTSGNPLENIPSVSAQELLNRLRSLLRTIQTRRQSQQQQQRQGCGSAGGEDIPGTSGNLPGPSENIPNPIPSVPARLRSLLRTIQTRRQSQQQRQQQPQPQVRLPSQNPNKRKRISSNNSNEEILEEIESTTPTTQFMCHMCLRSPTASYILNCGHLPFCNECSTLFIRERKKCPICKTFVTSKQRAYIELMKTKDTKNDDSQVAIDLD